MCCVLGSFVVQELAAAQTPSRRYYHASVLVGAEGSASQSRGVSRPKILVFGGDDGVTFTGDLWALSLGGLELTSVAEDQNRDESCFWRVREGGSAWQDWLDRCAEGDISTGLECSLQDLLTMAWCKQELQTVVHF